MKRSPRRTTSRSPGEFDDFAARSASYVTSPGGIATILGWIAIAVALGVMQSAYFPAMLDIADGRTVHIGSFFKPRATGKVVVATLIVEILCWIGFGLCLIGGILARALLLFTIVALLDHHLSAVEAVKSSYRIAKANFGKRSSRRWSSTSPMSSARWRAALDSSLPSRWQRSSSRTPTDISPAAWSRHARPRLTALSAAAPLH